MGKDREQLGRKPTVGVSSDITVSTLHPKGLVPGNGGLATYYGNVSLWGMLVLVFVGYQSVGIQTGVPFIRVTHDTTEYIESQTKLRLTIIVVKLISETK